MIPSPTRGAQEPRPLPGKRHLNRKYGGLAERRPPQMRGPKDAARGRASRTLCTKTRVGTSTPGLTCSRTHAHPHTHHHPPATCTHMYPIHARVYDVGLRIGAPFSPRTLNQARRYQQRSPARRSPARPPNETLSGQGPFEAACPAHAAWPRQRADPPTSGPPLSPSLTLGCNPSRVICGPAAAQGACLMETPPPQRAPRRAGSAARRAPPPARRARRAAPGRQKIGRALCAPRPEGGRRCVLFWVRRDRYYLPTKSVGPLGMLPALAAAQRARLQGRSATAARRTRWNQNRLICAWLLWPPTPVLLCNSDAWT